MHTCRLVYRAQAVSACTQNILHDFHRPIFLYLTSKFTSPLVYIYFSVILSEIFHDITCLAYQLIGTYHQEYSGVRVPFTLPQWKINCTIYFIYYIASSIPLTHTRALSVTRRDTCVRLCASVHICK